eukprot:9111765-Karenia_brevis.AAC.1
MICAKVSLGSSTRDTAGHYLGHCVSHVIPPIAGPYEAERAIATQVTIPLVVRLHYSNALVRRWDDHPTLAQQL